MNELFESLYRDRYLLEAALQQPDGPDLLWLAQSMDRMWLIESLQVIPFADLLVGGRLPVLSSTVWDEQPVTQLEGEPGNGFWVAFIRDNNQGLLVPNDGGEMCWSVFLAAGDAWIPVRLFLDTDRNSLRRIELDVSGCMIGQNGRCIPLRCQGECHLHEFAFPVPCRKCACQ